MSRGNVEDSSIDIVIDEDGETSSEQPGLQTQDGEDVSNRLSS